MQNPLVNKYVFEVIVRSDRKLTETEIQNIKSALNALYVPSTGFYRYEVETGVLLARHETTMPRSDPDTSRS